MDGHSSSQFRQQRIKKMIKIVRMLGFSTFIRVSNW